MSRFRKQLLFLCDALLFAVAVAGYKFITVLLPYTEVGAKGSFPKNVLLLYGCTVIAQLLFKTYDSLWRYAESREYLVLMCAAVCGFGAYEIFSRALLHETISFVLLAAIASLWVLEMLAVRFGYRMYRTFSIQRDQPGAVPVAIIGAGSAGVQLLNEIQHNPNSRYHVQCFFDDDPAKVNKRIRGVPISGFISQALPRMRAMDIHEAIFAIPSMDELHRKEILRQLADRSIRVSTLPSTLELIDQKPIRQQLREVRIEDLLGRPEIKISMEEIVANFKDKTIFVTGAAGSIGSELCRQLATFGVKELILFDNGETPMHNLRLELEERYPALKFIPVIGDVRIPARLDFVFRTYHPQVVFHAAAYKHVPLMEENPCEAVLVNVAGTRNVADKCIEYDVEKMVMISTDKAVNPTNVMGCTKRLAEIYVQSLGLSIEQGRTPGKTRFVTTRFGNVLGSNGSVIPRFRDQISKGGPVTVTHPDITRFFMTIPEACRLVMEAATMSTGNQIFVFDMGESVKIAHLARRMISLAGFEPEKDIRIEYPGLRPGEKLYEEVLSNKENTEPTLHDRIRIAKVREYDYREACEVAEELETLSRKVEIPDMVRLMKKTVPEFKSKNSRFEVYDK